MVNTDNEIWRPVVWRDGTVTERYYISDRGRVRANTQMSKSLLKQHPHKKGYRMVHLYQGKKRYWVVQVHVLVLTAFVGARPHGHDTDHINKDRADNRPENLRWLIAAENRSTTPRSTPEYKTGLRKQRAERLRERTRQERLSAPRFHVEEMPGETWTPVIWRDGTTEPMYSISNLGRVRSWSRGSYGRLLTPRANSQSGKLRVALARPGERWLAYLGPLVRRSFSE